MAAVAPAPIPAGHDPKVKGYPLPALAGQVTISSLVPANGKADPYVTAHYQDSHSKLRVYLEGVRLRYSVIEKTKEGKPIIPPMHVMNVNLDKAQSDLIKSVLVEPLTNKLFEDRWVLFPTEVAEKYTTLELFRPKIKRLILTPGMEKPESQKRRREESAKTRQPPTTPAEYYPDQLSISLPTVKDGNAHRVDCLGPNRKCVIENLNGVAYDPIAVNGKLSNLTFEVDKIKCAPAKDIESNSLLRNVMVIDTIEQVGVESLATPAVPCGPGMVQQQPVNSMTAIINAGAAVNTDLPPAPPGGPAVDTHGSVDAVEGPTKRRKVA